MNRKGKTDVFVEEGYNVVVSGRHVLVTDAMKDYAIEKVSKLERFSPRLIDVYVTMDIQKLDHRVDIHMRFNNLEIKSHSVTEDMYASIDKAVNRLQTQLIKYKSKIQDHHARGVKEVDMVVNVIEPHRLDDLHEVNSDIDEETRNQELHKYTPHKVVAQEKKKLKFLTTDEAIMKLELSQDDFLLYRSEEDRKIKVMYRRNDGNYGVLEPEA